MRRRLSNEGWAASPLTDGVYDGARYQLRVDLPGGGSVVTFIVPEGAQRRSALTSLN